MTIEILIVLLVLITAVVLFITEKLPVDLVALLSMGVLLATGILTAEEGMSGFSDNATITIAAMFILSAGLFNTGVVSYLGRIVVRIFHKNFWIAILFTMVLVGIISAFINNTPVVAIFLPILLQVAKETKISASKLLIPLSFASIFGGVCTLIGTSTNILVSSIASDKGVAPFSMFEFSHLGIIIFAAGIVYMMFIGIPLIPKRRSMSDLTNTFSLGEYMTEIILDEGSDSIGKTISESPLVKDLKVDVIEVQRDEHKTFLPASSTVLKQNDVLRIKCNIEKIKELQEKEGILLKPGLSWKDEDISAGDTLLMEAIISPNSILVGKNLKQINFKDRFGATALAIRHRGRVMYENVSSTKLVAGDALLIEVEKSQLNRLRESEIFLVISEAESPSFKKSKIFASLFIIAGVVTVTTLGILPISISSVLGALLLILTGCLNLEQAYKAIDWKIVMLLAGSLSLGLALEKTGAAKLLSDYVIGVVGSYGPVAILSAFYILTLALTEAMSNNATAALVTPIALVTAQALGVDPRPFLITVMMAASLAFMSPMGYQTHLLIYNPGNYRYSDFLKIGTPLNILFWIICTFLIPILFPFK